MSSASMDRHRRPRRSRRSGRAQQLKRIVRSFYTDEATRAYAHLRNSDPAVQQAFHDATTPPRSPHRAPAPPNGNNGPAPKTGYWRPRRRSPSRVTAIQIVPPTFRRTAPTPLPPQEENPRARVPPRPLTRDPRVRATPRPPIVITLE